MGQFPDAGLYRVSRVAEWLHTNSYIPENMGYKTFREFAEDFPEMFGFQNDNNDDFILIKKWQIGEQNMYNAFNANHPADSFFGSANIILNDDIIEMTQRSLYALTKILGNGYNVQQMKQEIYDKFDEAKKENRLTFFGERYTFPVGYCQDGLLVNGIITKNLSPIGKSLYFSFDKTKIYKPVSEIEYKTPPVVTGSIPPEDCEKIYKYLVDNFELETPIHMASVSKFLNDHGITRMRYGYYKMKDFLADLDFLNLDEVVLGGVPQIMVTIHLSDKYDYTPAPKPFSNRESESGSVEITDYSLLPTGRLSDFCNLPAKPVSILENFLMNKGIHTDYFQICNDISDDFEEARQNGTIRSYENKFIFPCRFKKDDGSNVELTIKPSAYEGKAWFLYFVDIHSREKNYVSGIPGKQLENFAFLGSWANFLTELASKAIDEEWDFSESPRRNFQILIQYIKYTFSRLVHENKVCISFDKKFASFNTGLVDNHYDDIYACFIPNDAGSDTEWKFTGFCTAASGGLGKELVNYFNPLPQPASYFSNSEDLYFDCSKPIHTDFDHIIIDNIKRLPIQFLYDQFFDNPEGKELIEKIKESSYDRITRNLLYDELKTLVSDNSRLYVRIQNRIKDSIELAKKRVRWNYKTAVPSYVPKRDSMSLILPLALLDEMNPDVALVVELTRSGSYQGKTILTLPQAYIDARLVCRLTGDWLVPKKILSDSSEGSEDFADAE